MEHISFVVDELNKLPSGVYSILGVIVGFGLTLLKDYHDKKPRLYYSIQPELMPDDWNYALTTKTGKSGFMLNIFNIGSAPVFLDALRVSIKGKIVADIIIGYQKLMPYEQYEHSLEKQDYEAIWHWCHKSESGMLQITAHTVSGKKICGNLDVAWLAMQKHWRQSAERQNRT